MGLPDAPAKFINAQIKLMCPLEAPESGLPADAVKQALQSINTQATKQRKEILHPAIIKEIAGQIEQIRDAKNAAWVEVSDSQTVKVPANATSASLVDDLPPTWPRPSDEADDETVEQFEQYDDLHTQLREAEFRKRELEQQLKHYQKIRQMMENLDMAELKRVLLVGTEGTALSNALQDMQQKASGE